MAQSPRRLPTRREALLGYLRFPALYPELLRLAARRLFRREDRQALQRKAEAWCRARALGWQDALRAAGIPPPEAPFSRRHADLLAQSHPEIDACPFPVGPADLDLLHAVAEHLRAMRVVETGVAHGWSSLALLTSLATRDGSRLVSTDMLMPHPRARDFVGCVVPPALRSRWTLILRPDRASLPGALDDARPLDLCHYDSDKSYPGRRWAYPLLWQALRPGGVFISDDVGDNPAFRDFAEEVRSEPIVMASGAPSATKYVGILVKPDGGLTSP